MANAKKCDRCGEYYDKPGKIKELYIVENNTSNKYDLCDDCAEELCEFLRIKRE